MCSNATPHPTGTPGRSSVSLRGKGEEAGVTGRGSWNKLELKQGPHMLAGLDLDVIGGWATGSVKEGALEAGVRRWS